MRCWGLFSLKYVGISGISDVDFEPMREMPEMMMLIYVSHKWCQHKINQQAYGGLLHQIVQSNPFLAHKYTP